MTVLVRDWDKTERIILPGEVRRSLAGVTIVSTGGVRFGPAFVTTEFLVFVVGGTDMAVAWLGDFTVPQHFSLVQDLLPEEWMV